MHFSRNKAWYYMKPFSSLRQHHHIWRRGAVRALFLLAALNSASAACGASIPRVAIDVGHSLASPGATSARGVPEFLFNAGLAGVLRKILASNKVPVVSIGDDGDMHNLRQRTASAAAEGVSFFLSIHHDSVQPQYLEPWNWRGSVLQYSDRFSGFSLFVSRKNPRVEVSLRCASAIGLSLRQAGFLPSEHHAENVKGENKEWADKHNGVYYYDDLVVLKTATMPAVLLEAGVIVNRNEEERIQLPDTREAIARAVMRGISECGVFEQSSANEFSLTYEVDTQ